MANFRIKKLIPIATMMLLLVLMTNCKKEDDNNDSETVVPSERQLNMFSAAGVGFYNNPPTLVGDYIYIGTSRFRLYQLSANNCFYKLNASLGKVWEYPLGTSQVRGAASLDDFGNIYFVADSGRTDNSSAAPVKLYSLDNNGNFRWSRDIYDADIGEGMINLAISDDNTIYVGGATLFFAFDTEGNEKWSHPINGNMVLGGPIIDASGNIYFNAGTDVFSLNQNGTERWHYVSGNLSSGLSSPAFSTDYLHLIVPFGKTIYCLQTSDGQLVWEYTVPAAGDFRATPAVDDNNNIYVGLHGDGGEQDESTMYAIRADGSGIIWQNNIGSDLYSSPAIGDDRVLYFGSEGHGKTGNKFDRLHAIDMTTGNIIWSAQLEMDVTFSSPAISNSGILYVATMDISGEVSGVYSFQTGSTGLMHNTGSPRFHEGNASNGRRE